jgi:hypothetical protein
MGIMDIIEFLKSNSTILLAIIPPILLSLWKIISKTKFYNKLRAEAHNYYLLGRDRKFLILSIIFVIIGIGLFAFYIYSSSFPHQTVETYTFYPVNLIGSGNERVLESIFDNDAILINRNQQFWWIRGWNENMKLKTIKLHYYTPGSTVLKVDLVNTTYIINETTPSPLVIKDISLYYPPNINYGLHLKNLGNAPFYLFSIETEEESQQSNQIGYLIFGIYSLIPAYAFYKKDKGRKAVKKPMDLLYKDAKLADKIEYIQIELENCRNMLKYLEVLKEKGELSEKGYVDRRSHFENHLEELNHEKDEINSEIEDIKRNFDNR